ncbi:MAG: class I SAM-dependent methyltransferase [Saprospirales bacterium]|nr:MAG: class I SAM-dependent methyltransferase [Saprospirales bacterium]
MREYFREWFFRKWYWYISKVDRKSEILLMNYGYHDPENPIELADRYEKHRFSVQLYHILISRVAVSNKNICEIGSGRGGGLSYIHQRFKPASSVGVELNQKAVNFCNKFYSSPGISFLQGDAQKIPLKSETMDVVLNVESSHRYNQFSIFLDETKRVLKGGGYLLLTDFRYDYNMEALESDIEASEFEVVHREEINNQVINALKEDDARRKDLVKRLVPSFLRTLARNFAGAVGSKTFHKFEDRRFVYFLYVLRKKKLAAGHSNLH